MVEKFRFLGSKIQLLTKILIFHQNIRFDKVFQNSIIDQNFNFFTKISVFDKVFDELKLGRPQIFHAHDPVPSRSRFRILFVDVKRSELFRFFAS